MVRRLDQGHARYGGRVLRTFMQPFLIEPADLAEVHRAVAGIAALAERVAADYLEDPSVRDFFRFPAELVELIEAEPRMSQVAPIMRMDGMFTEQGMAILEINTDGSSGMNDSNEIEERFLEAPILQELLRRYEYRIIPMRRPTLDALLSAYRDLRGSRASARPLIAFLDWEDVGTREEFIALQEHWERAGHSSVLVDPRHVERDGESLTYQGRVVDIFYKRVLIDELLYRRDEVSTYLDACAGGQICQVGPFRGEVIYTKEILAFLSDPAHWDRFTRDEVRLIQDHIPWTRRVVEGKVCFEGRQRDLLGLLREERERFVLKPARAYGGRGVAIGTDSTSLEWEQAMAQALQEVYVVQEFVPVPEMDVLTLAEEHPVERRHYSVGTFVFSGKPGGLYSRVSAGNVVNVSAGGATLPTFVVTERG